MRSKIICVIPARLQSSRFPEKVIRSLHGKPLMQWTWEAAERTQLFDEIILAVDAAKTAAIASAFGAKVALTSITAQSGTDRLIEVAQQRNFDGDLWVNWQCDEPFITKAMIAALLTTKDDMSTHIWTLKKAIDHSEEINNPNIVKVVADAQDNALYFSRSPIPYPRDTHKQTALPAPSYYKHIGTYAYSSQALKKIALTHPCMLEQSEQLEQLRFLFHGLRMKVHETTGNTIGIDTPADFEQAKQLVHRITNQKSNTLA